MATAKPKKFVAPSAPQVDPVVSIVQFNRVRYKISDRSYSLCTSQEPAPAVEVTVRFLLKKARYQVRAISFTGENLNFL